MARPKLPLPDLDELERLCTLHPTVEEIAAFFKVSKPTAERWLRNKELKEIVARGRGMGKLHVRRKQLHHLDANNVTMAVFLGKVMLGQRESIDVKHSGKIAAVKRYVGIDLDKV
jgi:hypothetical protein